MGGGGVGNINVHMLHGGCYASDGWVGFRAYINVP